MDLFLQNFIASFRDLYLDPSVDVILIINELDQLRSLSDVT